MKLKGKILKIKTGYNPNSSSIGTHLSLFIKGTAVVAALFTLVYSFLETRRARGKKLDSQNENR
jgi:hypothetical protein